MSKHQSCEFAQEQKKIPVMNSRMFFWNNCFLDIEVGGYKDVKGKDYCTAAIYFPCRYYSLLKLFTYIYLQDL